MMLFISINSSESIRVFITTNGKYYYILNSDPFILPSSQGKEQFLINNTTKLAKSKPNHSHP